MNRSGPNESRLRAFVACWKDQMCVWSLRHLYQAYLDYISMERQRQDAPRSFDEFLRRHVVVDCLFRDIPFFVQLLQTGAVISEERIKGFVTEAQALAYFNRYH